MQGQEGLEESMEKKINADGLIFDVDGTLWDTTEICARVWNKVMHENSSFREEITPQQLMQLFGKPMNVIFDTLFPGIAQEEEDRLSVICVAEENDALTGESGIPYPGVVEGIRELSGRIPLYIVSNCQSGYIELCMKDLGIEAYITDTACFGDNPVSKGQNILALMQKNGLQHPVYVGDTQGDADACSEAGIRFAFASYGFGTVAHPDFVIPSFSELLMLF